jgi:hypothetical protein
MAIVATLKLDGKEPGYNLLECEYSFNQPVDKNGKPCANPEGGIIKITIQAPNENDPTFHKWMFSKTDVKQGVIEFTITVGAEKSRKILQFEHAHCINLYEYFNKQNTELMIAKITISAAIISFGGKGTNFTNNEMLAL